MKRVFVGAGCNRVVNNVSWGASNLVAFGAHNAVAIFCPKVLEISLFTLLNYATKFMYSNESFAFLLVFCLLLQKAQIVTTLPGHKASVNCTFWLPSAKFAYKGALFAHFHPSFIVELQLVLKLGISFCPLLAKCVSLRGKH